VGIFSLQEHLVLVERDEAGLFLRTSSDAAFPDSGATCICMFIPNHINLHTGSQIQGINLYRILPLLHLYETWGYIQAPFCLWPSLEIREVVGAWILLFFTEDLQYTFECFLEADNTTPNLHEKNKIKATQKGHNARTAVATAKIHLTPLTVGILTSI